MQRLLRPVKPSGMKAENLARFGAIALSPGIRMFPDMAELVMQPDLVMTIDSASAHLAGVLNVPVWTMLAHVTDWRREEPGPTTTLLYPSMQLFHQQELGDWGPAGRVGRARITPRCREHARRAIALPSDPHGNTTIPLPPAFGTWGALHLADLRAPASDYRESRHRVQWCQAETIAPCSVESLGMPVAVVGLKPGFALE